MIEFLEGEGKSLENRSKTFIQYKSKMNLILASCFDYLSYVYDLKAPECIAELPETKVLPKIYQICSKMESFEIQV